MPPTVGPMSNMKQSCKGWSFIAGGLSSDLDIELDTAHYHIMVYKVTEQH